MTSDRYLPRAPSLRPAPRKRPYGKSPGDEALEGLPTLQELNDEIEAAEREFRPVRNLPQADLPAPPTRGPWEPKED